MDGISKLEYFMILCAVGLAIGVLSKFVETINFNPMMVSDECLSTFTGLVADVEPDAWVAFHINSNKFLNSKQNLTSTHEIHV